MQSLAASVRADKSVTVPWMQSMPEGKLEGLTGAQVVEHFHGVPGSEQTIHQVGADESGPTRHETTLHEGTPLYACGASGASGG